MGHPWRRRRLAARKGSGGSGTSGRKAIGSSNGATRNRTATSGSTGSSSGRRLIPYAVEPALWRIIQEPTPTVLSLVREMHPDWSLEKIRSVTHATRKESSTE